MKSMDDIRLQSIITEIIIELISKNNHWESKDMTDIIEAEAMNIIDLVRSK